MFRTPAGAAERGLPMNNRLRHDVSAPVDLTRRQMVGPVRTSYPMYVDLLPPCNDACPAGENIQAWLAHAQAGRFQKAWEALIRDNPFPAIHGRVCYHPCETSCIAQTLTAASASTRSSVSSAIWPSTSAGPCRSTARRQGSACW